MKSSTSLGISRSKIFVRAAAPVALAAAILVPIAHGAGSAARPSAITDVQVAAKNWALTAPAQIPAGLVRFTLTGVSDPMGTMAIVGQLHPNVSQDQAAKAIVSGDVKAMLKVLDPLGGPFGNSTPKAVLNLTAGTYAVFTVGQDPKGKPQASYKFIQIAPSAAAVVEPSASATISEKDMKFQVPSTVAAGDVTFKVVNRGPSVHETILARLHAGVTQKSLMDYLKQENPSGPPPVDFAGVGAVMASGHSQWVQAHLTPGTYVLLCFIPDKHGIPHAMDGMVKTFTVR